MISKKELIGGRIKSLRESKGLTQEGLAEIMDINAKYLSNIERGKENPTLDMLIKFVDALEVEMWEIFDFGHEVGLKELRDTISKFMKDANEEKLKMVVKFLRAIMR